jgi:hypothetical protein
MAYQRYSQRVATMTSRAALALASRHGVSRRLSTAAEPKLHRAKELWESTIIKKRPVDADDSHVRRREVGGGGCRVA